MSTTWPGKPTCHGEADGRSLSIFPQGRHWRGLRVRDPEKEMGEHVTYRSCSYCGSMHPSDLYDALMGGALLGGSDWKYGYPHKFYVEKVPVPADFQERDVCMGSTWANGAETNRVIRKMGSTTHGKFYTEHLTDEGYEPSVLKMLIDEIGQRTRIFFDVKGGKLGYAAPYHGYQPSTGQSVQEYLAEMRKEEEEPS